MNTAAECTMHPKQSLFKKIMLLELEFSIHFHHLPCHAVIHFGYFSLHVHQMLTNDRSM